MKLYICSQRDNGSDPFAVVASPEDLVEEVDNALADQSDARVLSHTIDNGNFWIKCHDEDFGAFTIIAEPQKKIYGYSLSDVEV